jgi:signal transduction histidine kinase
VIFSLRLRMMAAVGLLAIAAVAAVALAARQRTRSEFRRFRELEKISAYTNSETGSQRIAGLLEGRCCDPDALRSATAALTPQQVLVVTDSSGRVVAKSGKPLNIVGDFRFLRNSDFVSIEAARHDCGGVVTGVSLRFEIPGIPLRLTNGSTAYLYVFPFPNPKTEGPEALFLGSLDHSLLFATILIAALALLATWILTRRIAEPIEELRAAARDLAGGNLARRVVAPGSDEIAELGRSFNAMAATLEKAQGLRRNLVHDVVHELRTPLAALRCRIDSITDAVCRDPQKEIADADEEIDHLLRLVEDLHELALAEARELRLTLSEEQLLPIVESAARSAGFEGDPRFRMMMDRNLVISSDVVRLRQVMLNLLSNAARHTPNDGRITVSGSQRGAETVVDVHNTGSHLTAEEIAHIFDRFYRADPSRQRASGGTGLGLSIVKHLIEAQGGRVWSRSDHSGVSFAFALPALTSGTASQHESATFSAFRVASRQPRGLTS